MITDLQRVDMIKDGRKEFKSTTFSNHKRTEVRGAYIDAMYKGKPEPACHWCCELVTSGCFIEIWECIFFVMGEHIGTSNPKLVMYVHKRYQTFFTILSEGLYTHIIDLRNHDIVRRLLIEITAIITLSTKTHGYSPVKIDIINEFEMAHMCDILKAPDGNYATCHKNDPAELYMALNELSYNLEQKHKIRALYWIDWLIEFDIVCRKRDNPCNIFARDVPVDAKYQIDLVWTIWEQLSKYAELTVFLKSTVKSLQALFTVKYTSSCLKKRRSLLYCAVSFVTDNIDTTLPILSESDKEKLSIIMTRRIPELFTQIRVYEIEVAEEDDEKLSYSKKQKAINVKKSMHQLNLLASMTDGSLPNTL